MQSFAVLLTCKIDNENILYKAWVASLTDEVTIQKALVNVLTNHNVIISPRNSNLDFLVRIKFYNFFSYISKQKLKNLLARTKFYWSLAGGPVFIMRTDSTNERTHNVIICVECD